MKRIFFNPNSWVDVDHVGRVIESRYDDSVSDDDRHIFPEVINVKPPIQSIKSTTPFASLEVVKVSSLTLIHYSEVKPNDEVYWFCPESGGYGGGEWERTVAVESEIGLALQSAGKEVTPSDLVEDFEEYILMRYDETN